MRKKLLKGEAGQSVVEYLLVLCVIVSGLMLLLSLLKNSEFFYNRVTAPLVKHITYNYKYGDPSAQGWDEGNPRMHIQIATPNDGQTFRLFQPTKD